MELPNKKYKIVYADPAWQFGSKQLQKYNGKRFKSLDKEYFNTDSKVFEQINVKSIADKDCVLFMWTTDAHIQEALDLIKAWGFKYKTIAFIWQKVTKNGKQVATLGAWTMKNCEICLLATKGTMLQYKKVNNVYQLQKSERTKHSKKPDLFANKIIELFGDLPRIELFARDKKQGWDAWGNEVSTEFQNRLTEVSGDSSQD